jgi:hypothetical protein
MSVGKRRYHFAIDDHDIIDNQVRHQGANVLIVVEYRVLPLWLGAMAALPKFDHQCRS